jgi:hypothetical protein
MPNNEFGVCVFEEERVYLESEDHTKHQYMEERECGFNCV